MIAWKQMIHEERESERYSSRRMRGGRLSIEVRDGCGCWSNYCRAYDHSSSQRIADAATYSDVDRNSGNRVATAIALFRPANPWILRSTSRPPYGPTPFCESRCVLQAVLGGSGTG